MTLQEAGQLLALVKSRYPNANFGDPRTAARAWEMTLDDVPYEAAESALRAWFKRDKWPPDPSELRGLILSAIAEVPESGDAWEMVRAHLRATYPGLPGPGFAGPEAVRRAVEALGGWHALRVSEQPERDRDAFFRVYPQYAKRAAATVDVDAAIAGRLLAVGDGPVPGGAS